jgi:hypothetical protein
MQISKKKIKCITKDHKWEISTMGKKVFKVYSSYCQRKLVISSSENCPNFFEE